MRLFLTWFEERPCKGLFPADHPGVECVLDELQRLLLDVAERGFFQVPDHVRGDAENACDLVYLELACLQELCLLG